MPELGLESGSFRAATAQRSQKRAAIARAIEAALAPLHAQGFAHGAVGARAIAIVSVEEEPMLLLAGLIDPSRAGSAEEDRAAARAVAEVE